VIGHSEGGIIAAIMASRRTDVDFIVMMAGPGLNGEQILLLQSSLIARNSGEREEVIEANQKLSKGLYEILKKYPDTAKASVKIRSLIARFDKKYASDTSYHKLSGEELALQLRILNSPWFRCFLVLDPEDYLSKVHCNVLAMIGSLDLQVPSSENLEAIEKALIFGGNPNYTIIEMPGLNHLFQTAKTGGPEEYSKIEETISPKALETMGEWISKTIHPNRE
jgi:hypothetical protein